MTAKIRAYTSLTWNGCRCSDVHIIGAVANSMIHVFVLRSSNGIVQ
jgi:hypothetical protein